MYKNAQELQEAIDSYFETCDDKPTITGLAYHLGFESRQSFYDYQENPEYSYSIKKARLRVEGNYEKMLHKQSCAGAIFALKNFGWMDSQSIDHTTKGEKINSELGMLIDKFLNGQ